MWMDGGNSWSFKHHDHPPDLKTPLYALKADLLSGMSFILAFAVDFIDSPKQILFFTHSPTLEICAAVPIALI